MPLRRNVPPLLAFAFVLAACAEERAPAAAPAPQGAVPGCADGPPMCSQDRRLVIQCQRGAWVVLAQCGGAATCTAGASGLPACEAASGCAPEGSYACGPDRASLLVCRGGRSTLASTCRGPRGCAEGDAVACDHSVAAPGDACDDPGSIACAPDRRTMVRCQSGVFAFAETCRNACLSAGGRVLCQ